MTIEETKINDDPSTKAEVVVPRKTFVTMTDSELMNEMLERGLEIPMDDGKLVRGVALKKLSKKAKESMSLDSFRKMRVIFHRTGKESEAPYVFMSLNGTAFQAPYEVEVSIPEPVIRGCIDNAVSTEYDMKDFDSVKGSTNYSEKSVRAYPYTFLGYEEAKK